MSRPLALVALLLACSSAPLRQSPESEPEPDAGPPPKKTTSDAGAARPDAAPDLTLPEPDSAPARPPEPVTCDEVRAPHTGVIPLLVQVDLTYGGKLIGPDGPVRIGDGDFTVTNLRFYVSEVAIRSGAQETPVNLVDAKGGPVPYNTHLVNMDDPAAVTFRVAAPPGSDYTGLSFILGLTDACDRRNPSTSKPPLTFTSQMTWPPPFGFLYLRFGALVTRGFEEFPSQIHMGGFPGAVFAPRVEAPGSLVVGTAGGTAHLRMAVDEMIRAAGMPAVNEGPIVPPGSEVAAGNALRQNVGKVSLFTVSFTP